MIGAFIEWNPGRKNTPGWVIDGNGCHIWVGTLHAGGYGYVRVDGRRQMAHKARYEREVGRVPDGLELDHLCRRKACVNPAHLEAVTHKENMLRGVTNVAAVNARKTHCPMGHRLTRPNLVPSVLKRGARLCRICDRARPRNLQEN